MKPRCASSCNCSLAEFACILVHFLTPAYCWVPGDCVLRATCYMAFSSTSCSLVRAWGSEWNGLEHTGVWQHSSAQLMAHPKLLHQISGKDQGPSAIPAAAASHHTLGTRQNWGSSTSSMFLQTSPLLPFLLAALEPAMSNQAVPMLKEIFPEQLTAHLSDKAGNGNAGVSMPAPLLPYRSPFPSLWLCTPLISIEKLYRVRNNCLIVYHEDYWFWLKCVACNKAEIDWRHHSDLLLRSNSIQLHQHSFPYKHTPDCMIPPSSVRRELCFPAIPQNVSCMFWHLSAACSCWHQCQKICKLLAAGIPQCQQPEIQCTMQKVNASHWQAETGIWGYFIRGSECHVGI